MGDEGLDDMRAECERHRDALLELAKIHATIDAPDRMMQADDPGWIGRLRKICLHAVAIAECEIRADVEHVMAPELRAAYRQMAHVWQRLPDERRPVELDGLWWANEANSGMLAKYDHPTGFGLAHSAGWGGFGEGDLGSYVRLTLWVGRLGLGYGIALGYLAQTLGATEDIDSRVSAVLQEAVEGAS
ncbi:MAG: hypothetical protein F4Z31_09165 [Gemmatimonadetes bacterium]|nr:hypothetical protein [Gemmatimonadota bacterium]MYE95335.1 hypothetical protein [Gemmatimonadota bacterium]MYJ11521.1 hypothetical protein [Gemmatimonadota bacterium]